MQNQQRAGLDKQRADVAAMFDGVAKRYDLFNTVLSLGQVHRWRRAAVAAVAPRPGQRILDLAAGTGTSSAALAEHGAFVVASDISLGMLQQGRLQQPDLDFVAMFHGVDERVPTASLEFGARVLDRFLDQA